MSERLVNKIMLVSGAGPAVSAAVARRALDCGAEAVLVAHDPGSREAAESALAGTGAQLVAHNRAEPRAWPAAVRPPGIGVAAARRPGERLLRTSCRHIGRDLARAIQPGAAEQPDRRLFRNPDRRGALAGGGPQGRDHQHEFGLCGPRPGRHRRLCRQRRGNPVAQQVGGAGLRRGRRRHSYTHRVDRALRRRTGPAGRRRPVA